MLVPAHAVQWVQPPLSPGTQRITVGLPGSCLPLAQSPGPRRGAVVLGIASTVPAWSRSARAALERSLG